MRGVLNRLDGKQWIGGRMKERDGKRRSFKGGRGCPFH